MPANTLLLVSLPTVNTYPHSHPEKTVVFSHIYDVKVQVVVSFMALAFEEEPKVVAYSICIVVQQQNITALLQFTHFLQVASLKTTIEVTLHVHLSIIDDVVPPAEYLLQRLTSKFQSFPVYLVDDPKDVLFWLITWELGELPLFFEVEVPCH